MSIDEARLRELVSDPYQHVYSREWREMAKQLLEARAEIEWLKSDLYHAIQALHCSAPNELMSV